MDSYEERIRLEKEERRRKKDELRAERRRKRLAGATGTKTSTSTSTTSSPKKNSRTSAEIREGDIEIRRPSRLASSTTATATSSAATNINVNLNMNTSTSTSKIRKRDREGKPTASDRIKKLKEDKKAEEGLRLINEIHGTKFFKASDLFGETTATSSSRPSSTSQRRPRPRSTYAASSLLSSPSSSSSKRQENSNSSSSWRRNDNKHPSTSTGVGEKVRNNLKDDWKDTRREGTGTISPLTQSPIYHHKEVSWGGSSFGNGNDDVYAKDTQNSASTNMSMSMSASKWTSTNTTTSTSASTSMSTSSNRKRYAGTATTSAATPQTTNSASRYSRADFDMDHQNQSTNKVQHQISNTNTNVNTNTSFATSWKKTFASGDSSSDESLGACNRRLQQRRKDQEEASSKVKVKQVVKSSIPSHSRNNDQHRENIANGTSIPIDTMQSLKGSETGNPDGKVAVSVIGEKSRIEIDVNNEDDDDDDDDGWGISDVKNITWPKPEKKHENKKQSYSSSDDDCTDLYMYSRRKKRQRGGDMAGDDDDDTYHENAAGDSNSKEDRTNSTSRHPGKTSSPSVDLWDDGSDADKDTSDAKKTQKDKNKSRRGRKGYTRKKRFEEYESDVGSDEDDSKLETQLKPSFLHPRWDPTELEPFPLQREIRGPDNEPITDHIPAALSRYIQGYQKEGVRFMHRNVTNGCGCVLGDDMGLGKTAQVITLIAALQQKKGNKKDLKEIRQRHKLIDSAIKQQRQDEDDALLQGATVNDVDLSSLQIPKVPFAPILIIVPVTLVQNWEKELRLWGHFAVSTYVGPDKALMLSRVQMGKNDILLCPKSRIMPDLENLSNVNWELIVVDEFHQYKNASTKAYQSLEELRNSSRCPLIGLTGTLMSNDHKELWTLIDLVQPDILGEWNEFSEEYSKPLKLARAKGAKQDVIQLADKRCEELNEILGEVFLKRDKNVVLEDELPEKNQIVVFCDLSQIQKCIYRHIVEELPEYQLLRTSNTPCDCGVNRAFFVNYKALSSNKQRVEYYRSHQKEIIKKKQCCYSIPDIDDDRVVLWPAQHVDNEQCKQCPSCILFPAISKLSRLCSHASLIQAERHPDNVIGEKAKLKMQKEYDFARVAIPPEILPHLPGRSYVRGRSVLDDHQALSGKMTVLNALLQKYQRNRDRVLLFSYSTTALDFIQQFCREHGYTTIRLDGKTKNSDRQDLVDQYQQNDTIFIFLISTLAGGMGLNLTAANKVIIYDVNWNPAHDEQAQDRAFRIGQKRDVEVVRLVAQGTIEELQYMRQVYKVHLKKQTLGYDKSTKIPPARIFRAVHKDKNRKGELFGLENLLKFKDGSFMQDQWKSAGVQTPAVSDNMYKATSISQTLKGISEVDALENGFMDKDEMASLIEDGDLAGNAHGFNHEDFLRADRGDAALRVGDEGYDEELGGASQLAHMACDLACKDIDSNKSVEEEHKKEMGSIDEKLDNGDDDGDDDGDETFNMEIDEESLLLNQVEKSISTSDSNANRSPIEKGASSSPLIHKNQGSVSSSRGSKESIVQSSPDQKEAPRLDQKRIRATAESTMKSSDRSQISIPLRRTPAALNKDRKAKSPTKAGKCKATKSKGALSKTIFSGTKNTSFSSKHQLYMPSYHRDQMKGSK